MRRAILTLLAGGAAAQVLPLLLGPWLTRLYSPEDWGAYALFISVATNVAVVACARYDLALPLARSEAEATDLLALCLRILLMVTVATALGAAIWSGLGGGALAWCLPLCVLAMGASQLMNFWSTRVQHFKAVSWGRVVQYGGAAAGQGLVGMLGSLGSAGLVLPQVAATGVAALMMSGHPPQGSWRGLWRVPLQRLWAVALKHRAFPLLNTPHAFAGALQDTLALVLLTAWLGPVAAGLWALSLRYLKAPATLVGSAVSQALYPHLAQDADFQTARRAVRRTMLTLALLAVPLLVLLMGFAPALFAWAFGDSWRAAGELARALAPYIAMHFVAAPLAVVTLAWHAQAWALRLAVVGQVAFLLSLCAGLALGGLTGAAWAVSGAMTLYFGYYFWRLATWPAPTAAH